MSRRVTRTVAILAVGLLLLSAIDLAPRRLDFDPPIVETPAPLPTPRQASSPSGSGPVVAAPAASGGMPGGAPDDVGEAGFGAPTSRRFQVPGRGGYETPTPTATPRPVPVVRATRPPARLVSGFAGGRSPRPLVSGPTRSGLASTYGAGWSERWVALPDGPGWRFRVCGAGGCRELVSTDAGPDLASQRAGRIVDLPVGAFSSVCGVPWTMGLCNVTVTILGRA